MFGVLIRNKDLLFPDVRNRPSDSGAFENALWSPFVRDNYKKDIAQGQPKVRGYPLEAQCVLVLVPSL